MKKEHSNPYTVFAKFYDYVLGEVDYDDWYRFLRSAMIRYNPDAVSVLEIGCGTGKFGPKFALDGFSIVGLDLSLDMLKIAKKRAKNGFRIICADASKFSFHTKFDFIFSVHDTVNYITDEKKLLSMFKNAASAMNEKSIFLFDTTTEFNILENFKDISSDYFYKGCYVKWSNTYDFKKRIISSTLKFSEKDKVYTEIHDQKIYTQNEIKKLIKKADLEIIDVFGDSSFVPPSDETIMVNYVTRRRKCRYFSLFRG